jgi:hypothetical protein
VVLDVTDPSNPTLTSQRNLQTTDPYGSYPEGWRVFIYGGRLYLTTRETLGPELHIFDISTPTLPTEIGNGVELNRTVNELVVRDQKIGNVLKRFLFLASDSDTKELGVFDVTNDTVNEINSVDLTGTVDALSLNLLGTNLYLGRAVSVEPELYVFSIVNPNISLPIVGRGETGGNVTGIKVYGKYAYVGVNKTGQEFQIWNSDYISWISTTLNSGRFTSYNFTNLSPLGFDINNDWAYLVSQSTSGDLLKIIYTP